MLTEAEAARIPHLYALARPLAATPPLAEVRRPGTEGTHQGYVDRAELALDAETRTVVVVVRVPDPFGTTQGPPLLLGQYVTVEIEGPKLASAWRIPAAAIRHGPPDADAVWQVDEDQALARVPVDIAHRGTDEAWVTGELREDRPVVIGALQTAVEGMKLRPREADACAGLRPRPARDVRPARDPLPVLHPAVRDPRGHPVRAGRRRRRARRARAADHDPVAVRHRRAVRGHRQRRARDGRLRARGPRGRGVARRRDRVGCQAAVPPDPAHLGDHLPRARPDHPRAERAGALPRADGGVPRVRFGILLGTVFLMGLVPALARLYLGCGESG